MNDSNNNQSYDSDPEFINYDEEIDRKWMEADLLEYNKNRDFYEKMRDILEHKKPTKKIESDKIIISSEDCSDNMGYIIEHHKNSIYTTFWIFEEDDKKNEKITDKRFSFISLEDLYEKSKLFVNSDLINYSLLHQSKYRMMCDFITYYETNYKK